MNKQEAIESLRDVANRVFYRTGRRSVHIDKIVELVNQIEEPQKPVVPKFVAEWLEHCRRCNLNLQMTLYRLDDDEKVGDWAYDENDDLISEKVDMIARAWLDGYETEKEKLYTVEIPNQNLNAHTVLQKTEKGIVLISVTNARWRGWESSKLTEAEIKQDFEWAWQWAKPVEVE